MSSRMSSSLQVRILGCMILQNPSLMQVMPQTGVGLRKLQVPLLGWNVGLCS